MILRKLLQVSEQIQNQILIVKVDIFLFCQLIAGLKSEKLEWGNPEQLDYILETHPDGFDLVLGADIYILTYSTNLMLLIHI